MQTEINWTRAPSGYCGNPRYVCHYLHLLTAEEKADPALIGHRYAIAVKRANRIGGRKYHNKRYGGGIVFQSYSLDETEAAITRVLQPQPVITLRRTRIEVGTGKPGYRWAPAYIVTHPDGREEFPPVKRSEALARAREIAPDARIEIV